jgi:hypothetical protein
MNRESKFAKAVRFISNICVFVLPILVILYFLWLQNIQLIILINYKIILFGCDLILWIVFLLNLVVLAARKRIALGIILFLMTAPCLTISSLCLIGFLPGYSPFVSNLPQIDDHIQFEKNTYYLTSEIGEWGISHQELYKCGGQTINCEQLGEVGIHSDDHFIPDVSKNELNIVNGENNLIYTYGEHSRSYEDYSKTRLGNHLYYVSEDCNTWANDYHDSCGTYIYSIYDCGLNIISCNRLPFQYIEGAQYIEGDGYPSLQVDSTAKEINFYIEFGSSIQNTLIYTYGPHPRCYVNGCTITSEQK